MAAPTASGRRPSSGGVRTTQLSPTGQYRREGAGGAPRLDRPGPVSRKDATPLAVVVKLDYDSAATYEGGVGLAHQPGGHRQRPVHQRSGGAGPRRLSPSRRTPSSTSLEAVPARFGQSLRLVYGGWRPPCRPTASRTSSESTAWSPSRRTPSSSPSPTAAASSSTPTIYDQESAAQATPGRGDRRRARHRRLAGAPVLRRPGQPRRAAGCGRRHFATVRLRRQPAHRPHRRLRLQQQADRRRAVPATYLDAAGRRRALPPPATTTATAPHRVDLGRQRPRSSRSSASAGPDRRASRPGPG